MKKKTSCLLLSLLMSASVFTACTKAPEGPEPELVRDYYKDVIEMIDAIPEASFETEDDIVKAYNEYLDLSSEEKALVTNSGKLEELNKTLADLYNTSERRGERINRNQILIGTYCFNFSDEAHVKELADAGFNYITATNYDKEKLDNLAKYNIGAFIGGLPQWRGGDRLPEDPQPEPTLSMETYAQALSEVPDHEAIWGIDIIDEPSALDYPFLSQQVNVIYQDRPEYLAYINLHPLHGRARLGTVNQVSLAHHGTSGDYSEYISNYVRDVDIDFICYDHYFYQNGSEKENELVGALYLQSCVAQACQQYDKDFWIVLQCNSRNDQTPAAVPLSTDQLKLQAYLALTFGARAINWACWNPGWWEFNVYDRSGNRTEQYEKVAEVNETLHDISPIYIKYKYVDTCALGRADRDLADIVRYFDNKIEQDTFKNIQVNDLSFIMSGYFEKTVGSKGAAMMFLNISDKMCDYIYAEIATVSFEVDDPNAVVTAYIMGKTKVLEPENGVYSFSLENAEYAFVTVE